MKITMYSYSLKWKFIIPYFLICKSTGLIVPPYKPLPPIPTLAALQNAKLPNTAPDLHFFKRAGSSKPDSSDDGTWERSPSFTESQALGAKNRLRREKDQNTSPKDAANPILDDPSSGFSFDDRTRAGSKLVISPANAADATAAFGLQWLFGNKKAFTEYHWEAGKGGAGNQIKVWASSEWKCVYLKVGKDVPLEKVTDRLYAGWRRANRDVPFTEEPYIPRQMIIFGITEKKSLETFDELVAFEQEDAGKNVVLLRVDMPNYQANPDSVEGKEWDAVLGAPVLSVVEEMMWKWRKSLTLHEIVQLNNRLRCSGTNKKVLGADLQVTFGQFTRARKTSKAPTVGSPDEDTMDTSDGEGESDDCFDDLVVEDDAESGEVGSDDDPSSPDVDSDGDTNMGGGSSGDETETDSEQTPKKDKGKGKAKETDTDSDQSPKKDKGKARADDNPEPVINCDILLPDGKDVSETGFAIQEMESGKLVVHPGLQSLAKTAWASSEDYDHSEPSYARFLAKYRLMRESTPGATPAGDPAAAVAQFEIYASSRDQQIVVADMPDKLSLDQEQSRPIPVGEILRAVWCKAHGESRIKHVSFLKISRPTLEYLRDLKVKPPYDKINNDDPLIVKGDFVFSPNYLRSNEHGPIVESNVAGELALWQTATPPLGLTSVHVAQHANLFHMHSRYRTSVSLLFHIGRIADEVGQERFDRLTEYVESIQRGIRADVEASASHFYQDPASIGDEASRDKNLKQFTFAVQPKPQAKEVPLSMFEPALSMVESNTLGVQVIGAQLRNRISNELRDEAGVFRRRYRQVVVSSNQEEVMKAWAYRSHAHMIIPGQIKISSKMLGQGIKVFKERVEEDMVAKIWDDSFQYFKEQEIAAQERSLVFVTVSNLSARSQRIVEMVFERAELSTRDILRLGLLNSKRVARKGTRRDSTRPETVLTYESAYRELWYAILGLKEVRILVGASTTHKVVFGGRRPAKILAQWVRERSPDDDDGNLNGRLVPEIVVGLEEYPGIDEDETLKLIKDYHELAPTLTTVEARIIEAVTVIGIVPQAPHGLEEKSTIRLLVQNPLANSQYRPWDKGPDVKDGPFGFLKRSGLPGKETSPLFKEMLKSPYSIFEIKVDHRLSGSELGDQDSQKTRYRFATQWPTSNLKNMALLETENFEHLSIEDQQTEFSKVLFAVWRRMGGLPYIDRATYLGMTNSKRKHYKQGRCLRAITIYKTSKHTSRIIEGQLGANANKPAELKIGTEVGRKGNALFKLLMGTAEVGAMLKMFTDYAVYLGAPQFQMIYIERRTDGNFALLARFSPQIYDLDAGVSSSRQIDNYKINE